MCGQVGQVDLRPNRIHENKLRKFYDVMEQIWLELTPNYRVMIGTATHLIPMGENYEGIKAIFGGNFKDGNDERFMFNARVEYFRNKEEKTDYTGPFEIFRNRFVNHLLLTNRCIVPVDFFVEQPSDKKIKEKYVIKREDDSPIYLGGVWNSIIVDQQQLNFFSLLTTAKTNATAKAKHDRSPLIVPEEYVDVWLSEELNREQLEAFFYPAETDDFLTYEVHPIIASRKSVIPNDDPLLIQPI